MFLDFAEDQARRRKQIFLSDWQMRLDDFLRFNERSVLPDAGRVSREYAHGRAEEEYAIFEDHRRLVAETDAMRQLETAARDVEKTKSSVHKGKPGQK